MPSYIFITSEGYTYQPDSESIEPDIENAQVIGFALGADEQEAFGNLISENSHILETAFDRLTCIELKYDNPHENAVWFSLKDWQHVPRTN